MLMELNHLSFVMRGHSASKTRVNALVTRASSFLRWIAGSSPAMTIGLSSSESRFSRVLWQPRGRRMGED
jgi:hypothetical protein